MSNPTVSLETLKNQYVTVCAQLGESMVLLEETHARVAQLKSQRKAIQAEYDKLAQTPPSESANVASE